MKTLMIDVANHCYKFLLELAGESTSSTCSSVRNRWVASAGKLQELIIAPSRRPLCRG
jgi:hypothetical protein